MDLYQSCRCDFQALNSKGASIISYADYAPAMVDEIEKGKHVQQKIGVVRE